ncbi:MULTISPECIES: MFS transporter [unclassified Streptomyces]|uniref:MFS transporter n=1 Tax=unclassified Streptomyces TaxID=2593676 RepID=UPI000A3FB0A9|nr:MULTISPECIES: MFS transporter [unclassified Streptomyces]
MSTELRAPAPSAPETEVAVGSRGRWIEHWEPGDAAFWRDTGRRVARRNLIWSVLCEHLGFTVWTLWSVVTVELSDRHFTADQLFWLVALPSLVGAVLRIPYTFAPARYGGRNWTVVSTLLLLVPAILLALALSDPATPYWFFLVCAASAGAGGGNFASSMANITHFYPDSRQGAALGLNAAGGNVGVSSVQLVIPFVIATFGLTAAGLVWIPLVLLAALGALLGMDNLRTAGAAPERRFAAAKAGQTWLVAVLYIGTFGSFVGFSTALPLLLTVEFPHTAAVHYAFLGALIGSCARPLGGMLADRCGGAVITLVNFLCMAGSSLLAWAALRTHSYSGFLLSFLLLFLTAGIGNGSTYRLIPSLFIARALRATGPGDAGERRAQGRRTAAAALGLVSAVGALGGFLVNRALGTSIGATGDSGSALLAFTAYYLLCTALTWACWRQLRGGERERADDE